MSKKLRDLLEEIQEEQFDLFEAPQDDVELADADADEDLDDDEEKDEKLSDHAPDGKGHYTADELREIIDYVYDVLKKEEDEEGEEGEGKKDDIGEIGLDLIYEYADLLPETVINQIVDDLKDIFEIEDTMLESIVTEGSAFFTKSMKGPAAQAAKRKMREYYRKNKLKIKNRNKKWRNSPIGKKMAALHKKIMKGAGKVHGKRVVHQM